MTMHKVATMRSRATQPWLRGWLALAALCVALLPGLRTLEQARSGEWLSLMCSAQGMKVLPGGDGKPHHDCQQCCGGASALPPAASPRLAHDALAPMAADDRHRARPAARPSLAIAESRAPPVAG
jgi:hypothetical protein